jgi:UPF0042 nucleotide-binding protein
MQLLIVSGRSGSGKTISLNVLEDLGYYCIDNLPVELGPQLYDIINKKHSHVAVSLDARNLPTDLSFLKEVLADLRQPRNDCRILYLDADDSILLQRFSETRRKHPLSSEKFPLITAIQKEHDLLRPIAELADITINTSKLTTSQLKHMVKERFAQQTAPQLQILLQSFAFKQGAPTEADFIFDVRCLPNPYWQPELRSYTGLEAPVKAFFDKEPLVQTMQKNIYDFLMTWIPEFSKDNRSYLTIAIGCTGGQHRSVYIANWLYEKLKKEPYQLIVHHREILNKEL